MGKVHLFYPEIGGDLIFELKPDGSFLGKASMEAGNDLITPHPEFNFPGLKEGDSWCICAGTYAESIKAGTACKIFLKKTNYKTLEIIPLEKLKKYAVDLS